MRRQYILFIAVTLYLGIAHGWVKDVDSYVAKRSPDKVEKVRSPLKLYQLLMWGALKFPQILKNFDNKRSDDDTDPEQSKRSGGSRLPLDFMRWRRMREERHKIRNRGSLMDPLASGLIG